MTVREHSDCQCPSCARRARARLEPPTIAQVADAAIEMYVEHLGYGYDEERAKAAAINEVLEGEQAREELLEEVGLPDTSQPSSWYISGCPVCGYSEHTPRPSKRCPNDGERLIRLEGRTAAWRRLEIAHRTVRDAIKSARRAARGVPW